MVTKDEKLHKGIIARRIRKQAENPHPPKVPQEVTDSNDLAVADAYPPLDAWLLGLFVSGPGNVLEGWESVLRRGADEHPAGSLEEWRLDKDKDDPNRLWLTVPRKGRGTDKLDTVGIASRARDLLKAEFAATVRVTKRVNGKAVGCLEGIAMRPPTQVGMDSIAARLEASRGDKDAERKDAARTAGWQAERAEKRAKHAEDHQRMLESHKAGQGDSGAKPQGPPWVDDDGNPIRGDNADDQV